MSKDAAVWETIALREQLQAELERRLMVVSEADMVVRTARAVLVSLVERAPEGSETLRDILAGVRSFSR